MNCNTYPGPLVGPLDDNYYSGLPCGYDVCAYQYADTVVGCEGQLFSENGRIKPNGILAKLNLPCQNSTNWNYDQCYSYYANGCYNTCQFINIGDIEDFM